MRKVPFLIDTPKMHQLITLSLSLSAQLRFCFCLGQDHQHSRARCSRARVGGREHKTDSGKDKRSVARGGSHGMQLGIPGTQNAVTSLCVVGRWEGGVGRMGAGAVFEQPLFAYSDDRPRSNVSPGAARIPVGTGLIFTKGESVCSDPTSGTCRWVITTCASLISAVPLATSPRASGATQSETHCERKRERSEKPKLVTPDVSGSSVQ